MYAEGVSQDLAALKEPILLEDLYQLVERWSADSVTADAVEPVLRFLEAHPDAELGTPGPLVHFVEGFRGEYEELLLASLERCPVSHTVWMLNRLINGTPVGSERERYIRAMFDAKDHPRIENEARMEAEGYLARLR